jgi:hypothetical protein
MLERLLMPSGPRMGTSATSKGGSWQLSLRAPAQGEIHDFQVTVHISCRSTRKIGIRQLCDEDRADVHRRIRETVRPTARTVPPDSPGEAERNINAALARTFASQVVGAARMRISTYAEVGIAEELRTMHQDRERSLHEVATRAEASKRTAEKYTESRVAWEKFLDEAQRSWGARYAIRLAQDPKNVAEVFTKMSDDRKEEATQFVSNLDRVAHHLERSNVFDMVTASDTAVRHAMQALGLSVPALSPEPLLPE